MLCVCVQYIILSPHCVYSVKVYVKCASSKNTYTASNAKDSWRYKKELVIVLPAWLLGSINNICRLGTLCKLLECSHWLRFSHFMEAAIKKKHTQQQQQRQRQTIKQRQRNYDVKAACKFSHTDSNWYSLTWYSIIKQITTRCHTKVIYCIDAVIF